MFVFGGVSILSTTSPVFPVYPRTTFRVGVFQCFVGKRCTYCLTSMNICGLFARFNYPVLCSVFSSISAEQEGGLLDWLDI